MVAYIVFTRERTRNQAELDTYSQEVSASLTGHDVTTRAYYGRQEVLEGAAVEGVVILEFPTFDEAKAWYDSPAYRQVREHRYKGADYRRRHRPRRVMRKIPWAAPAPLEVRVNLPAFGNSDVEPIAP